MYKDKEQARLASKERMRKHRQGVTKGVTKPKGVTSGSTLPEKLIDPVWRDRLTKIHQSLSAFNVADRVRLGVSGPTFDTVGNLLEVTSAGKPS